mmetsp:Transcript_19731/g.24340  ORF Transcript_19731/g.24340 Transcript_19731/m.24340 type:complete len:279 (-) Transcript_19731:2092-2928(-)
MVQVQLVEKSKRKTKVTKSVGLVKGEKGGSERASSRSRPSARENIESREHESASSVKGRSQNESRSEPEMSDNEHNDQEAKVKRNFFFKGDKNGKKNIEVRNGKKTIVKAPVPPNYPKAKSKKNKNKDEVNKVEDEVNKVEDEEKDSLDEVVDRPATTPVEEEVDFPVEQPEPEIEQEMDEAEQQQIVEVDEKQVANKSDVGTFIKKADDAFLSFGQFIGENTCHAAELVMETARTRKSMDVQEVLISTSVDTAYVLGENNTDDGVANGTEEESSENI